MSKKMNLLNNLSRENLLSVIDHHGQIARLKAQNAELKARLEKLETRLAKNSTHNSKPPRSDGLRVYFGFETVCHALCNAHHLRKLEFAAEHYAVSRATEMQSLLLEVNDPAARLRGMNRRRDHAC